MKEETISTLTNGIYNQENEKIDATELNHLLDESKFLLCCNVCNKCFVAETDMSQVLPCKHVYLQEKKAKHRKKYKSTWDEMCFRMKALM